MTTATKNNAIVTWLTAHHDEVNELATPDLLDRLEAEFPMATIPDFQAALRVSARQHEAHADELRRYVAGRKRA